MNQETKPVTVAERAHELAGLRSMIEQAEGELKILREMYRQKSDAMKELMANEGMKNLKIDTPDGPKTIYVKTRVGAKVENGEEFQSWCMNHGIDRNAYRMWSGSKLAALARECRDEEKPYPPGLDVYEGVEVAVRRG